MNSNYPKSKTIKYVLLTTIAVLAPFTGVLSYDARSEFEAEQRNGSIVVGNEGKTVNSSKEITKPIKPGTTKDDEDALHKVRRGTIESINTRNNTLVVRLEGKAMDNLSKGLPETKLILVTTDPDTKFYAGEEEMPNMNDMDADMKVYVFGTLSNEDSTMVAAKILIANKSKLSRK